jgi:hypothetical protein
MKCFEQSRKGKRLEELFIELQLEITGLDREDVILDIVHDMRLILK